MNSEHQLQAQTARHTAEIADILRRLDALSVDIRTLSAASLELVTGTAPIVAGAVVTRRQAISIVAATASVPGSMSAADKTKLDALIANEVSQSTLSATFTITGTSGTYQDTGLSVALPSAGTYLIFGDARVGLNMATGTFAYIGTKLWNSTDSAYVTNSETMLAITGLIGFSYDQTASIVVVVTVAAAKTIKLYAARVMDGTFTGSTINSDANGRTRLSYLKVA